MTKLKPCLQCGKPLMMNVFRAGEEKNESWMAVCPHCGYSHTVKNCTVSEAVKAYNSMHDEIKPLGKDMATAIFSVWIIACILGAVFCAMAIHAPWSEAARRAMASVIGLALGLGIGMAISAKKGGRS